MGSPSAPFAHAVPVDDSTWTVSAVPVHRDDIGGNARNDDGTATATAAQASASAVRVQGLGGTRLSSSRISLPPQTHSQADPFAAASVSTSPPLSDECWRELQEQGFTKGLATAVSRKAVAFPLTIWVVDNSGSMSNRDGHRIVPGKGKNTNALSVVSSTRWSEMQQTVEYHAQLSALLRAPTTFRLLNDPGRAAGPQQFGICCEDGDDGGAALDRDLSVALATVQRATPGGVTPLTGHIRDIRDNVRALEPQLRRDGTKVAIVLATDGLPTDDFGNTNDAVQREFVGALRSLGGLPVWIVIRLCTDDADIVEFWNQLDGQLELSLEVLDDFCSEAQEIHQHNRWLNYALPLHRMREMGFHSRVFDLLDERSLAKDELREFFRILFLVDGLPDPETDWDAFVKRVAEAASAEKPQWNPVSKRVEPWVNVKQLKAAYGGGWFFW